MDHVSFLAGALLVGLPGAVASYFAFRSRLRRTEEELERSGDYAYRLLEDSSFYRDQLGIAIEAADHCVRGHFGRIPNGPPLSVGPDREGESWLP